LCVEIDISDEEALRVILNKHRRSTGWNGLQPNSNGFAIEGHYASAHEPISKPAVTSKVRQN
jgi:hypothetical protein